MPARRLESTLTAGARREAMSSAESGSLDIAVVTPEGLLRQDVLAALGRRGVSLLAVDEAHCISSWGHDFRPAYLGLAHAANRLAEIGNTSRPPILALTATATDAVVTDIVNDLGLRAPSVVRTSPERENLRLDVVPTPNEEDKLRALRGVLASGTGQAIVYTATIKAADQVYGYLSEQASQSVAGATIGRVGRYHGDLSPSERADSQSAFMQDRVRVLVATKAFGMGVDKPDVRFIVHYQLPDSIESYAQEVGRAGRDGKPARAVLLYRRNDRRTWDFLHRRNHPVESDARAFIGAVGALDAGQPIADEALAEQFRLGERKTEMLLWELTKERLTRRSGEDFVRAAEPSISNAEACDRILARLRQRRERQRANLDAMLEFAESTRCRTAALVEHFGAHIDRARCGRCDSCDRVRALAGP